MGYRAQYGPKYYKSRKNTPLEERHIIQREKFGEKALIWGAIFICGRRSSSFITNESFDATLQLKKCFKIRFLPSIR